MRNIATNITIIQGKGALHTSTTLQTFGLAVKMHLRINVTTTRSQDQWLQDNITNDHSSVQLHKHYHGPLAGSMAARQYHKWPHWSAPTQTLKQVANSR